MLLLLLLLHRLLLLPLLLLLQLLLQLLLRTPRLLVGSSCCDDCWFGGVWGCGMNVCHGRPGGGPSGTGPGCIFFILFFKMVFSNSTCFLWLNVTVQEKEDAKEVKRVQLNEFCFGVQ